jgi:hypothetical protein
MNKPQMLEGLQTLEQKLNTTRTFTLGDIAAVTGYTIDQAKELMNNLMAKYDCRLKITENGDLIYDFGKNLHKRGERTWEEWWFGAKKALWKAFVLVFKVWITVTLVVYFALFVLILIAAIVAMMAANKDGDSDSDSGAGALFGLVGEIFRSIFIWNTVTGNTYYATDAYGYSSRRYESRPSVFGKKNKKKGKNFVSSVYDFVFGPPRVEHEKLANEKEAVAYIRQKNGIVTKPEIIALAGWNEEQADDFFSNLIVRYNGEAAISPNAVLYGDFHDLSRQKSSEDDAKIIFYWNEYEPEYQLTGNSTWRNAGVIFMNLFNLAFATFFLALALDSQASSQDFGLFVFLGWVPFIFSLVFFSVPVLRYFQVTQLNRKRHLENIRKRLMHAIYENADREVSLDSLLNVVNSQTKGEEKLSKETVESMMQKLLRDFDGEIELKDNAQIVYKFNRLKEELAEANRLRTERGSSADLGQIVFDTDE